MPITNQTLFRSGAGKLRSVPRQAQYVSLSFMVDFMQNQKNGIAATENTWLANPKIFNNWPFTEQICCPLY